MKLFMIRQTETKRIWSRNGWGVQTSTPDLYQTRKAAQWQIDEGKVASLARWWPNLSEIVEVELLIPL